MVNLKAIIVPGNGGDKPEDKWFPSVTNRLNKIGVQTTNIEFPDSILARAEYWLPFLEKLNADENTILIGHSSGAVAAMRYAEKHKIFGSVLVGAYYTTLGLESEEQSGYFKTEWDWEEIKANQKWIIQFASTNDPYIPINESRHVHKMLSTIYREYNDKGHCGGEVGEFSELFEAIQKQLK